MCSVARYSTDEQRRQSIKAQHRFNRSTLESAGIVDFDWEEVSDEGISGELRDRPGIQRLREGIANGEWDLIVTEDSSRLYRNMPACLELVSLAVDNKVRVICIGEEIDTSEEGWFDRLQEAQQHHCRSNKFTRHRIKRAIEDLWELGAAVGHLRPGYKRRPTRPATEHEAAEGPFFDEIDPQWAPVIHEAFHRVAGLDHKAGDEDHPRPSSVAEPVWSVAQWLTERGLPKTNNRRGKWTARNVLSLIRSEIYRGTEFHGKTVSVKKYVTGASEQQRNEDPDEVKQREMPKLRIVPDWLWYRANEAITSRSNGGGRASGEDHPLAGIRRDSRRPMSRLLCCGICRGKCYGDGRNEGGYRCSGVHSGKCWNKATCLRDLAHQQISQAIVRALLPEPQHIEAFVSYAKMVFGDEERWQADEDRLAAKEHTLRAKCKRLAGIIESGDSPAHTLVELLKQRELEAEKATAELEDWRYKRQTRPDTPTAESIREAFDQASRRLLDFDREAGVLLERLVVGKIWAVPYQVFQSNKVVLRAEFEINLVGILPDDLLSVLAGSSDWQPGQWLPTKKIVVDLFPPSLVPTHGLMAYELFKFLNLVEIGELLGISKRQAHLAKELGKAMTEGGLEDPYVRLNAPPEAASRWRVHPKHQKEADVPNSADESESDAGDENAAA